MERGARRLRNDVAVGADSGSAAWSGRRAVALTVAVIGSGVREVNVGGVSVERCVGCG
jgi:hypothetical protein